MNIRNTDGPLTSFHFRLDEIGADRLLKIGSDDPHIYVKSLGTTRDRDCQFALFWNEKVIQFSATESLRQRGNAYDVSWHILNIGTQGLNIAPFRFGSIEELRAATELALSALRAFSGRRAIWSETIYETVSVELSAALMQRVYGGMR